jgi:hypothetical protein
MAEDVTSMVYQLKTSIYRLKQEWMEPTRIDIQKRFAIKLRMECDQPPDPKWSPEPFEYIGDFMGIPMYLLPDAEVTMMVSGTAEAFIVTGAKEGRIED